MRPFEEKYHPDTMLANKAVHIFNDNAMTHFRDILQRKQKQHTLDTLFVKKSKKTIAEGEESTVSKRQKREKLQKENYPVL